MPKYKKHTVAKDELDVKEKGIYCFTPYENLDDNGRTVFKVGMAESTISGRIETHHTDYPMGLYLVAFLETPTLHKDKMTQRTYYKSIEKFIMDYLTVQDARGKSRGYQIESTTRLNLKTEWVYTKPCFIAHAFNEALGRYGGKMQTFHLNKLNQNEPPGIHYTGKTYFEHPPNNEFKTR